MRALLIGLALVTTATAAPPDDPYQASTWIAKLGDPRQAERAVTELEQLGDPSAIVPLGNAWSANGKPVRLLQVIISLARPLTPAEAKAVFLTSYETSGRPASWDLALPMLVDALANVDENNPRSVDSAQKAADAIGEAQLTGGLRALASVAVRPASKRLIAAQVSAVRALGKLTGDQATAPLVAILERQVPAHPRTAPAGETRAFEERYGLFLGISGAAINALGEQRATRAVVPLVLELYRTPELFSQLRRALVVIGPPAERELVKVLKGEQAEVDKLFKAAHLDKYCGDKGDAAQCQPVSARDFYAAVVLGDLQDPAAVPALLAAAARPPLPVYYQDDQPSPNTQHNAIFDALRRLGAPAAAPAVRARWQSKQADVATRVLAVAAYPFVARDTTGTAELAKIAADNTADQDLRQEAATALARLSRDVKDIAIFQELAKRYLDASAAKLTEAAGTKGPAANAAKAYLAYARMFQTHIARIEIALRCKADLDCYAASLAAKPDAVVALDAQYIPGLESWSADEIHDLVVAASERALIEIGKQGARASRLTDLLLDAARTDERLTRQGILLALPHIAPLPCSTCVTKLDAAIRAGEGKTTLGDLTLETQVLRSYFVGAGRP